MPCPLIPLRIKTHRTNSVRKKEKDMLVERKKKNADSVNNTGMD
jgi:hypothetical protein